MVYDCFLFYDELDLLEIRLNELWDVVDWFVLCEAHWDFKGNPKPLLFLENIDRFDKFLDKIRHIECRNSPAQSRVSVESYWNNEWHQRNQLIMGLHDCGPLDLILSGDVDEIPRRSILPTIPLDGKVRRLICRNYNYDFNHVDPIDTGLTGNNCTGIGVTTFETAARIGMNALRGAGYHPPILNAGWHFSWFGGEQKVWQKIDWYSHHIKANPGSGKVLVNGYDLEYLDDVSDLPAYILNNIHQYRHMFADEWRRKHYHL